jgi:hypothetical protein
MPFDVINTGTTANDGTGDPLRTAFTKTNSNFALAVEGPSASTNNHVVVFNGATGKLVADSGVSISSLASGLTFLGLWDASTNTPSLASGTGTEATYYIVSVAGSTTLDSVTSWVVGDFAIFFGGEWTKVTTASQVVLLPDGSSTTPSLAFVNDTGIGLYLETGTVDRVGVAGDLYVTGAVEVDGAVTLNDELTVVLDAKFDQAVEVDGIATFNDDLELTGTGAVTLPVGDDTERPTPATGMLRFNTDSSSFEGYDGSAWGAIGGGGGTVAFDDANNILATQVFG